VVLNGLNDPTFRPFTKAFEHNILPHFPFKDYQTMLMMHKLFFPLLLIFISFSSCKKSSYDLNTEFYVDHHETVIVNTGFGEFNIFFDALLEDSSCPPDVNCIHAGIIKVKIIVNKETEYELGLNSGISNVVVHEGRTITLLGLDYTKNNRKERNSRIKLMVQ
jgi:hypothetical protein